MADGWRSQIDCSESFACCLKYFRYRVIMGFIAVASELILFYRCALLVSDIRRILVPCVDTQHFCLR